MSRTRTIKVELISANAVLPKFQTTGAAGADLYAAEDVDIPAGENGMVPLGFRVEIPKGLEMQIRPRSGLAAKNKVTVLNTPGTIDSDFRGEVWVILMNFGKETFRVSTGDRIAQAVISTLPTVVYKAVEDLSSTQRGAGGFGSTGVK